MICKQASAQRQQLGSSSRGQEAEEADAHEATRQHMQEKASEELLAGERHLPLLIFELTNAIKAHGFEGIVAKRLDSCYESGQRSGAWLKMRVNQGQEFVIGGYTPGEL